MLRIVIFEGSIQILAYCKRKVPPIDEIEAYILLVGKAKSGSKKRDLRITALTRRYSTQHCEIYLLASYSIVYISLSSSDIVFNFRRLECDFVLSCIGKLHFLAKFHSVISFSFFTHPIFHPSCRVHTE